MRRDAFITIIRARRRRRFVILDQQAVDDERLSWAARGLLHYLLARPDDWKVLVKDLQRRGDLKRDGIYKLLKELRKIGYARLVWIRDEQGRVCGAIYYIYEQPLSHPDIPDTAEPDPALPDPVKPKVLPTTDVDLKRTTTTTVPTTTYQQSHAQQQDRHGPEIPSWIPEETKIAALEKVAILDDDDAQMVINEWVGAIEAGVIRESLLGYLHVLVKRFQAGEFNLHYAKMVSGE